MLAALSRWFPILFHPAARYPADPRAVFILIASAFYSAVALSVVGISSIQIIAWILGWAIACFIRWAQLQMLILEAYHLAEDAS
jgi:hypothetical protein